MVRPRESDLHALRARSALTARGLSSVRTWVTIYIEDIYRSFPVDVRIQCDVTQHMYFRFKVRYRVSFMLHMIIFRRL